MKTRIRILCVDDHPLLREGLAAIIRREPDMLLVGEASEAQEAVKQFREHQPDVTLMDLRIPDRNGIEATKAIRAEFPEARVIILTTFEADMDIQRALEAGARAYLLKSTPPNELIEAIRKVNAGQRYLPPRLVARLAEYIGKEPLTDREIEVLRQIAGNRNRDIADKLSISEDTVKLHIRKLMVKLGAADRTQAVAIAIHRGIIELRDVSVQRTQD